MRARDGREDERTYERRRRRIEMMARWRWMTDRTMRTGFTGEAGNPPQKGKKKDKDEGKEGRGRRCLPQRAASKDTVSSVNCTLSSPTAYLHQSSLQKWEEKRYILLLRLPYRLNKHSSRRGRKYQLPACLPDWLPPADPVDSSLTIAV